jgi:phage terminase Nu1 subunit (DNA packaging protein)
VADQNLSALDTDDVASLLGVSDRQVRNYVKHKGLPCDETIQPRRFSWPDVLEWYILFRLEKSGSRGNPEPDPATDQTESMEAALCRKTVAEADLKELELATKRGQVVAVADVHRTMANLSKDMQTKILSMPSSLSGQIVGLKTRDDIRGVLDRAARAICHDLSRIHAQPIISDPQPEAE